MREVVGAEPDAVATLVAVLGQAAETLRRAGPDTDGHAPQDLAAELGHGCLVLARRAAELADAAARSAAAFVRADVDGVGLPSPSPRPSRRLPGPAPSGRMAVRLRAPGVPPARPLPTELPAHPVAAVVAVARSQVGYREGRSNATLFGTWAGAPNAAWCASFVSWVFAAAGRPLPAVDVPRGFVGVGNGRRWAHRQGRSHRRPAPGDIVTTVRRDGRGHTGIVVAVLDDGRIRTVEGNTTAGGGREGVVVAERVRRVTPGMRFWRP